MITKKKRFFCVAVVLLLTIARSVAQEKYSIKAIPNSNMFDVMTPREVRIDTLKENHYKESLERMLDGTAFREGVTQAQKQESIAYHKAKYQRYKNNRSRYFMNLYVNNHKDEDFLNDVDTVTTECNCYLSGDTIKVKMGLWVFGGFMFGINLSKNEFESSYLEDTHKQLIYKTSLRDSILVDNVMVTNEEQALLLEHEPSFKVGEDIMGYLSFKTKTYYRLKEYQSMIIENATEDNEMDSLHMAGTLYFKCKVKGKLMGGE